MIELHDVVRLPTALLHEAPWNANVVPPGTLAKIRRSLRRYGSVENNVVRPSWTIGARSPADIEARRAALMDDGMGSFETLSGNHRLRVYREEGVDVVPCTVVDLADAEARILAQVLNRTRGADDPERLRDLLRSTVADIPMEDIASLLPQDEATIKSLVREDGGSGPPPTGPTGYQPMSMVDQFIVPPFSVLDARQGYWRMRKRQWIGLGIRSELGRDGTLTFNIGPGRENWNPSGGREAAGGLALGGDEEDPATMPGMGGTRPPMPDGDKKRGGLLGTGGKGSVYHGASSWSGYRGPSKVNQPSRTPKATAYSTQDSGMVDYTGTSIFDPVLCELTYRWFCPPGGRVLDPFAGGSVRGVVAGKLGFRYVGIDLSAEQVAANEMQADAIFREDAPAYVGEETTEDPDALTPVQRVGDVLLKRDDLFVLDGIRGGKVRAALLSANARAREDMGLVSAGSRHSTCGYAIAAVARALSIPAAFHTPKGAQTAEIAATEERGVEIRRHHPGRNSVLRARAREDAEARGWHLIPFGMECAEMVAATRPQVANLPWGEFTRIVVPVGGGMSLAGVLWGLRDVGRDVPVVGVRVGSKGTEARLDTFGPPGWRDAVTFVDSELDYGKPAPRLKVGDVVLDPFYEAKAIPSLRPGDLLWVVAIRPGVLR